MNCIELDVFLQTFSAAINSLHPSPTDSCSLWLNQATVAVLPSKCSRHNAPARPHDLTKVVRSCTSGVDEYIVVNSTDIYPSADRTFPACLLQCVNEMHARMGHHCVSIVDRRQHAITRAGRWVDARYHNLCDTLRNHNLCDTLRNQNCVRCSILDTRYSILDTRYSILDTRYSILDTRYSILDTRYSILDTRYSILDT